MNACKKIRALIYPYLDGELTARENVEIEEHLLQCQDCSDILQEQKRFLAMMDNPGLRDKGPEALKQLIARSLAPEKGFCLPLKSFTRYRKFVGLAIAASVLLLTFTVLELNDGASQNFLLSAVNRHQAFLQGGLPLDVVSANSKVVAQWLKNKVGIEAGFPEFQDPEIVLLGARMGHYKGQDVGLLRYKVHSVPVTLVIAEKTPETDIETSNYSFVGGRRVNFSNAEGFHVVSWSVCKNNFALISSLPHKGKPGCAVCHGNGSGLVDLSEFYSKT